MPQDLIVLGSGARQRPFFSSSKKIIAFFISAVYKHVNPHQLNRRIMLRFLLEKSMVG